jgi:hypothetical protein
MLMKSLSQGWNNIKNGEKESWHQSHEELFPRVNCLVNNISPLVGGVDSFCALSRTTATEYGGYG